MIVRRPLASGTMASWAPKGDVGQDRGELSMGLASVVTTERETTTSVAKNGTYEAAKDGVLAAAEYAVATSGTAQPGADEVIPLGVRKSFLKSALGDREEAYSNGAMRRFKKLSEAKKISAQPF